MSSVLITPNIVQVDVTKYEVSSFNPKKPSEYYTVELTEYVNKMPIMGVCSCPHFEFRHVQCKHIQSVISEVINK